MKFYESRFGGRGWTEKREFTGSPGQSLAGARDVFSNSISVSRLLNALLLQMKGSSATEVSFLVFSTQCSFRS